MASNFQSSFIPKEPMTEDKVFAKKKTGVFGVLAVSLFIISIIAAGAVYFYKGVVNGEIQGLESQMAAAEKSIDTKSINEMSQFAKKLQMTKDIVAKHRVVSGFLNYLSSTTVSTVQFTDFSYGDSKDGGLAVSLKGTTNSYASVALQESVFSKTKYFKTISFSGLNLNQNGTVSFDVKIDVDKQISTYAP
jgi:hypothetical protein